MYWFIIIDLLFLFRYLNILEDDVSLNNDDKLLTNIFHSVLNGFLSSNFEKSAMKRYLAMFYDHSWIINGDMIYYR